MFLLPVRACCFLLGTVQNCVFFGNFLKRKLVHHPYPFPQGGSHLRMTQTTLPSIPFYFSLYNLRNSSSCRLRSIKLKSASRCCSEGSSYPSSPNCHEMSSPCCVCFFLVKIEFFSICKKANHTRESCKKKRFCRKSNFKWTFSF